MKTTTHEQQHGTQEGFPWGVLGWSLAGLAGGHVAAVDSLGLAQTLGCPGWGRAGLAAAVAGWCACRIHAMRHATDKLAGRPWLLGFVLAAQWLILEAHHTLHGWLSGAHAATHGAEPHGLWLLAITLAGIAVFWVAAGRVHHLLGHRRKFLPILKVPAVQYARQKPLGALVLFVSNPTTVPKEVEDGIRIKIGDRGGEEEVDLTGGDIGRAITMLEKDPEKPRFHNWIPLLRALEPHRGLSEIYLLGSPAKTEAKAYGEKAPPEDGSAAYLPLCEKLVRLYAPKGCRVVAEPAVDFEAMEELTAALEGLLGRMKCRTHDYRAIDITGGQKTNSILGTMLTLHSRTVVQYVQTAGDKRPYIYNLEIAPESKFSE